MSIIVFQSRIQSTEVSKAQEGQRWAVAWSWLVPFRFGVRDFNFAAGQLPLTVWELLVSWGKDLRLPVGLAFWGFGAATELIATPITVRTYNIYIYIICIHSRAPLTNITQLHPWWLLFLKSTSKKVLDYNITYQYCDIKSARKCRTQSFKHTVRTLLKVHKLVTREAQRINLRHHTLLVDYQGVL